jgi:3-carboxy-cis,cis-muconate cycloisomerase
MPDSAAVFAHPWLGGLFGDAEAQALWSEAAQLDHFRAFEAALAQALDAEGMVGEGLGAKAALAISTTQIDLDRLSRGTARDGIPIPDFVKQLRDAAPDCAAAIHSGATSQDVMDTALSLTLIATNTLLINRISALIARLDDLITAFGDAPLMARTRMQAALPVTVGDRIASWQRPLVAAQTRLTHQQTQIGRLQLGGAVGTRDAFGDKGDAIAARMAQSLSLTDLGVWHSDRSHVTDYASQLSLLSGALGKMGQDIALMAQQGVDEITLSGGGGSSAMAHKSNPVLAELLVTLARFNATQLAAMHHALVHEQERSGAAWMLEWMVLPQMAVATARATAAATELCGQITGIGDPR